jgi:hypothetical protein
MERQISFSFLQSIAQRKQKQGMGWLVNESIAGLGFGATRRLTAEPYSQ